jgi:hypothetical protein
LDLTGPTSPMRLAFGLRQTGTRRETLALPWVAVRILLQANGLLHRLGLVRSDNAVN